jgi:hypothetical protein
MAAAFVRPIALRRACCALVLSARIEPRCVILDLCRRALRGEQVPGLLNTVWSIVARQWTFRLSRLLVPPGIRSVDKGADHERGRI